MKQVVFLVDSDLHFKHDIRSAKADHVEKIIALSQKEKIDALICPGDLTDMGWDGKKTLCWKYGGDYDQLTPLKEKYIKPISKHVPVYVCAGNHDYYVPWPYLHHGVLDYIVHKYGGLRYSFDLEELHFIALDRYPDDEGIEFLKKDLKKYGEQDLVIFFHYNFNGPFSDWWSEKDKERFYNIIKDYKVKAIICGHVHVSKTEKWKDYKIIMAAAASIAKCTYKDGEVNVEYF